ncbi:MAG TPA: YciI family protein [Ramlibacter sp.]|nr:YciI family protein [Ramlibacter sp.]
MTATHFVVLATDRPESLALRERLRPAHRQWLRNHPGHEVSVIHAGPTLDARGQMNGTFLIVQASRADDVTRFLDADPYSQGSLFAEVVIRPWQWTLGRLAQESQGLNSV